MILPGFSPEIYHASKPNGQGLGLPEGEPQTLWVNEPDLKHDILGDSHFQREEGISLLVPEV